MLFVRSLALPIAPYLHVSHFTPALFLSLDRSPYVPHFVPPAAPHFYRPRATCEILACLAGCGRRHLRFRSCFYGFLLSFLAFRYRNLTVFMPKFACGFEFLKSLQFLQAGFWAGFGVKHRSAGQKRSCEKQNKE